MLVNWLLGEAETRKLSLGPGAGLLLILPVGWILRWLAKRVGDYLFPFNRHSRARDRVLIRLKTWCMSGADERKGSEAYNWSA